MGMHSSAEWLAREYADYHHVYSRWLCYRWECVVHVEVSAVMSAFIATFS